LDHTADVLVVAYGKTLAESFENAGLALFETMTNTKDVLPIVEEQIEVTGFDKKALLYAWLEEFLIKFEVNNLLFSRFKILKIKENSKGYTLRASVEGEHFNPIKHKQKVGVKAITYHQMEIHETSKTVTLRFLLDI
jgi:SHS2 domain-containing protein